MSFETLRSRGFITQTLIDFAAAISWLVLGALGFMALMSPLLIIFFFG